MRKLLCIVSIIISSLTSAAQVSFKTIVPKDPVIVGEAFPVQYVLENLSADNNCKVAAFKNFRLVSGPSVINVNNGHPLKNTVYTLEALKPGKYTIEGASIEYNGTIFTSNKAIVEVISKETAYRRGLLQGEALTNNDLYLKPGEDPVKKTSSNLFVKLVTDRLSCYVGEPVTATFKLYSRLESSSDIVKNPGFYGFTVYDIIGLKDNKTEKEIVNGKEYTVHIIRKAQLYPLKAGTLTIDEMEIENRVVFTDSPALRKVEQQIIEGVVAAKNKGKRPGTHEFVNSIHTSPVSIQVKDIPLNNKPINFSGAIGLFGIKTQLNKDALAVNEEAELTVTVEGSGNFTQLTAPVIQWPPGVEGFEPTVTDSLNNNFSPLKGKRVFHFPFVVTKAGSYSLPELQFSFFNPDTNTYKQVQTAALSLIVKQEAVIKDNKRRFKPKAFNTEMGAFAAVAVLSIAALFFFLWKKGKRLKASMKEMPVAATQAQLSAKEILQPAYAAISSTDDSFYLLLRQCIWNYLIERLNIPAVSNHTVLKTSLQEQTGEALAREVLQILSETEAHVYGGMTSSNDKARFYHMVSEVLERIDANIRK